jgi:hypothetical protein
MGDRLDQVGQTYQHQEYERHRGQQRIKGQCAGQEWDVVFVCGL